MKTDSTWSVVTVPGHILEKKLNQLTEQQYEVVTVERSGSQWTIITRGSANSTKKAKVIGFTAQKG